MRYMKSILYLALILSVGACTSSSKVPSQHFQLPENSGKRWSGQVGAAFQGIMEGAFYDFALDSTKISSSDVFGNTSFLVGAHLGLFDFLDIYYHSSAAGVVGAKWQFYGKSTQVATKGDYSAAIFSGYGRGGTESSVSSTVFDRNGTSKTEQDYWEYGISAGYRPATRLLTYVTLARSEVWAKDTYNLTTLAGTPIVTNEITKGRGDLTSLGFGLSAGAKFRLFGEVTYAVMNWSHDGFAKSSKGEKVQYGVGLAGNW